MRYYSIVVLMTVALDVLGCSRGDVTLRTTSQAVTCDGCPPVDTVTVVHSIGQPGSPTLEQLDAVQAPVAPGCEDPTVADMLFASEGVLATLPADLIDDAIDEFARIGGSRIGCVVDRTWTCYFRIGGHTYYCSVGQIYQCGSFLGSW